MIVVLLGCGNSHEPSSERDGGMLTDASSDGSIDAPVAVDAFVPGPTPEDAHDCGAWATYACGRYAECYSTFIWLHGSRERCEDALRSDCEHEESLEGTGDLESARVACATEMMELGCERVRALPACDAPSGTRDVGAPCRSDLQCGEGTASDGRTVRLRCFRDMPREPACDSGTCQLPLEEGALGCEAVGTVDHDRCDVGLACHHGARGPETSYCGRIVRAAVGEPCIPNDSLATCEEGYVCGPDARCERIRTNGEACDPGIFGHCGDLLSAVSQYCDDTSGVCMPLRRAFDGEACVDATEGRNSCGISSSCVEGTCIPVNAFLPRGAACVGAGDYECRSFLGCADGVCGAVPCE